MSKSDPATQRKAKRKALRWAGSIFLLTIFISGAISLLSEELMDGSGIATAFLTLLAIVAVGIVFDIIGVAVTSANEVPFHSMAARKVPGARECIWLLRNAERVGSICNDVVGDICGVVSGSASAIIAAQILQNFSFAWPKIISLLMSALVAAVTVGGKALGKTVAIGSCTRIVYGVGVFLYTLRHLPDWFPGKKKKR